MKTNNKADARKNAPRTDDAEAILNRRKFLIQAALTGAGVGGVLAAAQAADPQVCLTLPEPQPCLKIAPPKTNAPPAQPPAEAPTVHEVAKGDTLTSVAKKYGVSVKAIEEANPGVDPKALKIGQKILIPIKPPPRPQPCLSPPAPKPCLEVPPPRPQVCLSVAPNK
jgi:LysM repeat protein